ncbi:MAG: hypothetical protein ABI120_11055 [Gemmatimonadaceae bacterium]
MMQLKYARRRALGVASTLAGTIVASMAWFSYACAQPSKAHPSARAGDVSLESLLSTRISTAEKYLQTTSEGSDWPRRKPLSRS